MDKIQQVFSVQMTRLHLNNQDDVNFIIFFSSHITQHVTKVGWETEVQFYAYFSLKP